MSIKELESAIANLSPAELTQLAAWFDEFLADAWDKQIARDVASGRLNSLIEEAEADYRAGRCKPL